MIIEIKLKNGCYFETFLEIKPVNLNEIVNKGVEHLYMQDLENRSRSRRTKENREFEPDCDITEVKCCNSDADIYSE